MPPASELERIWAQVKGKPPLKPGEAFAVNWNLQIYRTVIAAPEAQPVKQKGWLGQLSAAVLGLLS